MSKDSDDAAERILALLVMVGLVPIRFCIVGYGLSWGWSWFVVPFGAPTIGPAHAVGLAILISWMRMKSAKFDDEERGPWASAKDAFLNMIAQVLVVVMLYFVHLIAGSL